MKSEKFQITADTGVIVFPSLGSLEVNVVFTKKQHEYMVKENKLEEQPNADDWGNVNGSMSTLYRDGVPAYIITIVKRSRRVVVHECIHCVHHIMDEKGIPISLENTEIMAYFTGYLTESVMDIIFNRSVKK